MLTLGVAQRHGQEQIRVGRYASSSSQRTFKTMKNSETELILASNQIF